MNTHIKKGIENQGRSATEARAKNQRGGEAAFQIVDNRPESIAQRKLQVIANADPRTQPTAQGNALPKPRSRPAQAFGKNNAAGPSARYAVQRSVAKGLRVFQARHLAGNAGPLNFDIAYSLAPKRGQKSPLSPPSGAHALQRLIVVDDDMDTSRLMAAVRIYYKHQDKERITTIHKAKDVTLAEGEKIYMVAHGAGDDHGGRSAKDLAAILKTWGLHPGSSVIKLISCFSGKDAPEWSYANALALELDFMYKVIGIKGLEATDEQGHTRATEQLVDDETFEKAYFGTLGDDKSFEKAEAVAKAVKEKIATCKLGEEVPLMVEAYEEVNTLCQGLFKKLEGALKGMTRDKEKRESEDIMTPL